MFPRAKFKEEFLEGEVGIALLQIKLVVGMDGADGIDASGER